MTGISSGFVQRLRKPRRRMTVQGGNLFQGSAESAPGYEVVRSSDERDIYVVDPVLNMIRGILNPGSSATTGYIEVYI